MSLLLRQLLARLALDRERGEGAKRGMRPNHIGKPSVSLA